MAGVICLVWRSFLLAVCPLVSKRRHNRSQLGHRHFGNSGVRRVGESADKSVVIC